MQSFRTDPMRPNEAAVLSRGRVAKQRASASKDQLELEHAARLLARLRHVEAQSSSFPQMLGGSLAAIQERPAVLGCMLLKIGGEGKLEISSHTLGKTKLGKTKLDLTEIADWLLPKALEGLESNLPIIAASSKDGVECIATPVGMQDVAMIVTVLQEPLPAAQRALEVGALQTVSAFLDSASQKERLHELSSQVGITATALELVQRVQHADSVDEACFRIVAELKDHFGCDQVFIGLTEGRETCRVRAASDVATLDPNAESTMMMKAVLDESIGRAEYGAWPPLPGISPHRLLAHKQIARRDAFVISTPLMTRDGDTIGALVIAGRREMASTPNLQHFLGAISEPLADTLSLVTRHQGSTARRVVRKMMAKKHAAKRHLVAAGICVAVGILFCPWPYNIRCQSVTEPVKRRFCVAPHDGLLRTTLAEPGDVVLAGQTLAQMDGRETLWDLAGVTAEKHRAEKKRDTHMANQETPEALMADLEARTLENKKALLEFRESNLQMTSPIEGIVLSGSLDRRENYPVTKGQVLYEIAPLDQLRIEVGVPADEVMHVQIGNEVEIYFDGFGTESVKGTIQKMRPRAEIREQDNVFVAEVLIENPDRTLRPGMNGIAKVKTDPRMIGWIVFHHAAEKLFSAMPW